MTAAERCCDTKSRVTLKRELRLPITKHGCRRFVSTTLKIPLEYLQLGLVFNSYCGWAWLSCIEDVMLASYAVDVVEPKHAAKGESD